jgi:hypothetical protein
MSHQDAGDNELVWMLHRTRTTGLEDPQDSMLPDIATALVPITATAWKAAQLRFMRWHVVPSDIKILLGNRSADYPSRETIVVITPRTDDIAAITSLAFLRLYRSSVNCFTADSRTGN